MLPTEPTDTTPPDVESQEIDDTYARIDTRAELSCLPCYDVLRDRYSRYIPAVRAGFFSALPTVTSLESDHGDGKTAARSARRELTRHARICHDDVTEDRIGLETAGRKYPQGSTRRRAPDHGDAFRALVS
jgi:hypothetical protein